MTQLYSPAPPLAFVGIVETLCGLEVAAIAVDRTTLEVRTAFAGRIEPLDGVRRTADPEAPRAMMHPELALGIGSVVDGAELVAWRVQEVKDRLEDVLAAGGRTVEFEGCFDLLSATTPILEAAGVSAEWLDEAAVAFALPAPAPHALSQARTAIAVLQRTRIHAGLGEQWARLVGDERKIAELAVQRLNDGRAVYGPWSVDDGRVYEREAIEEAADGFMYSLAALIRARRDIARFRRYRLAYLATGLDADHPTVISATKRLLARRILAMHPEPLVRQLVQGGLTDVDAKKMLVEASDEVCAVGSIDHPAVTEAMALAHAHRRTISFAPVEALS